MALIKEQTVIFMIILPLKKREILRLKFPLK
jgi:hypothetical protein